LRLFTAIELTEPVRAAIAAEQARIVESHGGGRRIRLVKPEQIHVTLVFIGEVAKERGAAITALMERDIPMAPFRISLGGIGAFPQRGAPRVLYVDIVEGAAATIALHALVAERLAQRDERPFRPHVTLGRWRESRPSDRPKVSPWAAIGALDVHFVTLFQSRISSAGPAYTRIAAARLVCP
jgi:RNA 2',3'-cyclic 3'-phosphodiesterase